MIHATATSTMPHLWQAFDSIALRFMLNSKRDSTDKEPSAPPLRRGLPKASEASERRSNHLLALWSGSKNE